MSERYITDRFLPDKAIDPIDEACSDVNLRDKNSGPQPVSKKSSNDIAVERGRSWSLMPGNAYERLAELRSKELQLTRTAGTEPAGGPFLTLESLSRVVELDQDSPAPSRSRNTSVWPSWKTA